MAAPSLEIQEASRLRLPPRRVILAGCVLAGMIIAAAGADWLAPYPFDELHVADRLHHARARVVGTLVPRAGGEGSRFL